MYTLHMYRCNKRQWKINKKVSKFEKKKSTALAFFRLLLFCADSRFSSIILYSCCSCKAVLYYQ